MKNNVNLTVKVNDKGYTDMVITLPSGFTLKVKPSFTTSRKAMFRLRKELEEN